MIDVHRYRKFIVITEHEDGACLAFRYGPMTYFPTLLQWLPGSPGDDSGEADVASCLSLKEIQSLLNALNERKNIGDEGHNSYIWLVFGLENTLLRQWEFKAAETSGGGTDFRLTWDETRALTHAFNEFVALRQEVQPLKAHGNSRRKITGQWVAMVPGRDKVPVGWAEIARAVTTLYGNVGYPISAGALLKQESNVTDHRQRELLGLNFTSRNSRRMRLVRILEKLETTGAVIGQKEKRGSNGREIKELKVFRADFNSLKSLK